MNRSTERLEQVERLKLILVQRATGGIAEVIDFVELRRTLMADPSVKARLPKFLGFCTTLDEFWAHIKEKFPSYQERRTYLRDEFLPLIASLEGQAGTPSDTGTSAALAKVDSEHVREAWGKALERREIDPDGAVTAARSLIEAVCKHILDNSAAAYEDEWQLPRLYSEAARLIKLSPDQHSEHIFKQILSGCHSVVNGMAGFRNRFGDAHGKGRAGVKPTPRHAELAVNLAGAMATFLIATWEARTAEGVQDS